jgi:hypothetical protein
LSDIEDDGRRARISKGTVDAAAPEATRFILWDTDLKGFGLRVESSGLKTYIVRYRVGGRPLRAPAPAPV